MLVLFLVIGVFLSAPATHAAQRTQPTPPVQKEWTYMIFMNGDNNLDAFADEDFQEMMKVGSSDWLNIVSLTDREKGPAALFYVEKDRLVTLEQCGEIDMGDYRVMVEFVRKMAARYPAKHYCLSIWNHGSGWKHAKNRITKGISYDDQSGNHITTAQLGVALAEIRRILGHNLDILSMDACLMQMMEVAWEIRQHCDFIVASEELEAGHGYPYDQLMAGLTRGITPEALCRFWVPMFIKAYTGGVYGTEEATLSAVRCSALPALKDALDGLAKTAIAGQFAPQVKQALTRVQKFDERTHVDLWHLVKLLKPLINAPEMTNALTKVEAALRNVIVANGNTGGSHQNALGLAIYFPFRLSQFDQEYDGLGFAKDSLHDEMLKDFFQKSTAQSVVASVDSGNLTALRSFVGSGEARDPAMRRHVVPRLKFRLYSESDDLAPAVRTEAERLLKSLENQR